MKIKFNVILTSIFIACLGMKKVIWNKIGIILE